MPARLAVPTRVPIVSNISIMQKVMINVVAVKIPTRKKSPKSNLNRVRFTISLIGGTKDAPAKEANGFVFMKIASPAQYRIDATNIPPRTEALIPFSFR